MDETAKPRKRVVIITNAPSPYRVDLFLYLQEHFREYEFFICFSKRNLKEWQVAEDQLEHAEYLQSLAIPYSNGLEKRLLIISHGMQKLLRRIKPAVIVASEYNQSVQEAFTWAKLHKVPFVSWTDGTPRSEQNFGGLRALLRKRIIRGADAFIASSSASRVLQMRYGAPEEKICISYLTVKTDAYLVQHEPLADGVFRMLFVGRLVKGKGLHLLFEALKRVEGSWQFTVAGDGPEREKLEALAAECGIADKVRFTGYLQREELTKLYARSDLFVLPTLDDCFGLVILEAMCAALPVVTTIYADGAPDLIEDGVSGVILDPNDPAALAGAIQKCMADPEYSRAMGEKALERTDIFHFRRVSQGYIGAIRMALGEE